jgi:hypothetical protein
VKHTGFTLLLGSATAFSLSRLIPKSLTERYSMIGALRLSLRTFSAAILFLAASAPVFAGTVSISSPSDGQNVTSPFRLVASASDADGVKLMKVWLDGKGVYEARASKIDTSISAATGTRRVTVQGYDNAGASFQKTVYVTVSSSSGSTGSNAKVYSNIEQMDGWDSCTGCAGGGEEAKYSMTRGQSSPSLDGNSTKFWIGGSTSYSHGLWWRRMASDTSSTNFVFELAVYIKEPSNSQGLEFAANQLKNDRWYKFSTQCSFSSPTEWRVWDSRYSTWRGTGIACPRPKAYTWTTYRFEYKREDGKAKFVSITVNGKKYYVNRSFYPQLKDGSGSIGIHYQMNGNKYQADYTTWVDKMKLTVW